MEYRLNQRYQPPAEWSNVGEIPRFPFEDFEQLRAAAAIRSFNLGVDSLAAARWSERFNTRARKAVIAILSLLLVAAGVASVIAAFLTREYWLLAATPIQAVTFYLSHPASPMHKWVTIGGAVSVAVFLDLLFNRLPIAAALVAYANRAKLPSLGKTQNRLFVDRQKLGDFLRLEVLLNHATDQ